MNVYRVVVCMNVYRGVPTGIYATNNPEACKSVAENCEANIIVVENEEQLEKILQVSIVLSRVPWPLYVHLCYIYLCCDFDVSFELIQFWVDVCLLIGLSLLLFLFRSKTIFLTWRLLCSTKKSSVKNPATKKISRFMRWHIHTRIQQQLEVATHYNNSAIYFTSC